MKKEIQFTVSQLKKALTSTHFVYGIYHNNSLFYLGYNSLDKSKIDKHIFRNVLYYYKRKSKRLQAKLKELDDYQIKIENVFDSDYECMKEIARLQKSYNTMIQVKQYRHSLESTTCKKSKIPIIAIDIDSNLETKYESIYQYAKLHNISRGNVINALNNGWKNKNNYLKYEK